MVPGGWVPLDADGVTLFSSADGIEMSVSVGDHSGLVTVCNAEPGHSAQVSSIGELEAAVETFPAGTSGGLFREWTGKAALDGWQARIHGPAPKPAYGAGPQANVNVFGILQGRPIVLRFRYSYQHQEVPTFIQARVVASFHLFDQSVSGPWESYTSKRDGYSISVPSTWVAVEDNGVTFLGSSGSKQLAVSVGDESGHLRVCNAPFFNSPPCSSAQVRSLDELGSAVTPLPGGSGARQQTIEASLNGWPARIEAPGRIPFLVGPAMYICAFGMIDGRPVVLRFNYSYRQQDVPTAAQLAVIDSFTMSR